MSSEITIQSGDEKLQASLTLQPHSDDAFLVCHGFAGSKDSPEEVAASKELESRGYSTLRISHVTGAAQDLIWQLQALQLIDTVSYLKERVQRVHLFGISMGASNALTAATTDSRVTSVASICGISDGEAWIKERHKRNYRDFLMKVENGEKSRLEGLKDPGISKEEALRPSGKFRRMILEEQKKDTLNKISSRTIRSLLAYKPILALEGLRGRPVFFSHGRKDSLVKYSHTSNMFRRAKDPKKVLWIEGGDHDMLLEEKIRKKIVEEYLQWLVRRRVLPKST